MNEKVRKGYARSPQGMKKGEQFHLVTDEPARAGTTVEMYYREDIVNLATVKKTITNPAGFQCKYSLVCVVTA